MAKTITMSEYDTLVKQATKPVVLEFGADWWPGCRMLRPVVSKISEDVTDVDFYYVNVDQSHDLANQFTVRSIPTLILIKNGKEAGRSVGFIPEEKVIEFSHS